MHEPGHTFPHAPQLAGSVATSTHEPPQFTWPGEQTQLPDWHPPPPQAFPQAPQFVESVERSTHEPLQLTLGAGQAPAAQTPFVHVEL